VHFIEKSGHENFQQQTTDSKFVHFSSGPFLLDAIRSTSYLLTSLNQSMHLINIFFLKKKDKFSLSGKEKCHVYLLFYLPVLFGLIEQQKEKTKNKFK
jgi:hypothetical protein